MFNIDSEVGCQHRPCSKHIVSRPATSVKMEFINCTFTQRHTNDRYRLEPMSNLCSVRPYALGGGFGRDYVFIIGTMLYTLAAKRYRIPE